jgi:hypothetical protein
VTRAEYEAEIERRRKAVDASGLPRCEWMAALAPPSVRTIRQRLAEIAAHTASCPVCKARNDYAFATFGPLPPVPRSLPVALFLKLPRWLQPPVFGACAIGAVVLANVIFASLGPSVVPARVAFTAIGLAMAAGALAGLAYVVWKPLFAKLGRPGDYLRGIFVMGAYMGAVVTMMSFISPGQRQVKSGYEAVIFGLITVGFGLFIGHKWRLNPDTKS